MKTNYLAVLVAAVAYWILGAIWFGVLFGKQWMAYQGWTEEMVTKMGAPVAPYIVSFLLNLLIAFTLAQVCAWRGAYTASRGASLGILLWIGFVGPTAYTTYMYAMRPKGLFAIDQFYPLVGFCIMGAILGAWNKRPAPSASPVS